MGYIFEDLSVEECRGLPVSPFILRRIFTLLLRQHFSNPNNYGHLKDYLGCFKYSQDTDGKFNGSLRVDAAFHEKFWESAGSPSVHIGTTELKLDSGFIAQQAGFSGDNASILLMYPATTQLQISHIAETLDQAFALAESTMVFIAAMSHSVYQQFSLSAIIPQQITQPKLIDKTPPAYRSDTVCTIGFQYGIDVTHESHRLKKVAWNVDGEV